MEQGDWRAGSFYRSQHELVFVFKVGEGRHVNNFGLGAGGRYRTNVWDYAGVNGFAAGRNDDLALHPTVKPVAMVKDALLDCSNRGDIVLDCFAGSGSTLAAAHKCGRKSRLIVRSAVLRCDCPAPREADWQAGNPRRDRSDL